MTTFKALVKWNDEHTTVATELQPTAEAAADATRRFLKSIGADENKPFEVVPVHDTPTANPAAASYRPGVYNGD